MDWGAITIIGAALLWCAFMVWNGIRGIRTRRIHFSLMPLFPRGETYEAHEAIAPSIVSIYIGLFPVFLVLSVVLSPSDVSAMPIVFLAAAAVALGAMVFTRFKTHSFENALAFATLIFCTCVFFLPRLQASVRGTLIAVAIGIAGASYALYRFLRKG